MEGAKTWTAPLVRRILAAAALGVIVLLVGMATSAQAHYDCVRHPSDPDALGSGAPNSRACLDASHTYVEVCDEHADGNYVYARVYRTSDQLYVPLYDNNGSASPCEWHYLGRAPWSFNVCVQGEGCGNPHYWFTPYRFHRR